VNSEGQSLIALAVANATAPGAILTSNRTGGSCDLAGASSSTTVPAKTTSGTPINPQGSTYWAATGAFISLFGGSDSPPGLGGGGSARGSAGNPFGALPRPESGKNAAGGDPICPYGYESIAPNSFTGIVPAGDTVVYGGSYSPNAFNLVTVCYIGTRVTTFGACELNENVGGCGGFSVFGDEGFGIQVSGLHTKCGERVYIGDAYATGVWDFPQSNEEKTNSRIYNLYDMRPGGRWEITFEAGNPATAIQIPPVGYTCKTADGSAGTLVNIAPRIVAKGDTLWDIAQDEYGDATRWPEIYAANTDVIGADPDLIFPGQVLRIP
jgi:hypothetical protein